MASVRLGLRSRALVPPSARSLFGFGLKAKPVNPRTSSKTKPILLEQDDLFHRFFESPVPAIRKRGELIRSLAPCPVCLEQEGERRAVQFDCPDCGWPTHSSEEHWQRDSEHAKYCSRLREANEDEHDVRSGRPMWEFKLPGEMEYEAAVSFANWDSYWFTRGHPSIDDERPRRHLSKLLTYPVTVSSVLHQFSGLNTRNQRVTPEGSRSLAALRMTLHQHPSSGEEEEDAKRLVRIFIVGARAESSLPPGVWQQLAHVFPGCRFHLFFIGPQVSLPPPPGSATASAKDPETDRTSNSSNPLADSPSGADSAGSADARAPPSDGSSSTPPSNAPILYEPPTPKTHFSEIARVRTKDSQYGVPAYALAHSPTLSITALRTSYAAVHHFFEPFDPYQDVFFAFSPGFGFPSPSSPGLTQLQAEGEWGGGDLPLILDSKCALFVTGFSPTDVERDVKSLGDDIEGVSNMFDWVMTPGVNPFGSEKWEVADFDPRVMVKVNWGVWGIRGKRKDIQT